MITRDEVAKIEADYQYGNQVDGVTFVRLTAPFNGHIRYATDSDNALFTGMYLAAAAYRYAVEPTGSNLQAVQGAVDGIRLLTSVTGTPGVLVRWVFPLENSFDRIGYDSVKSLVGANSYGDLIRAGQLYENEGYAFYTKATRDQISGVLFGLTAAYTFVPATRPAIKIIIDNLFARFLRTNWSLEDHKGKKGTSAYRLDAPLRLIVKALHRRAWSVARESKSKSCFFKWIGLVTLHYNRIFTRTFSFNLNMLDAHSLLLLGDEHKEKKGVLKWEKKLWGMLKKDNNPHFEVLHMFATGVPVKAIAWANLERRVAEPYYKFFSWQKDPKDWWINSTQERTGPGIDVLLPYWMREYLTSK